MVNPGEQVLDFFVAPIRDYYFCERNAAPAATAVIHAQHDKALGGKHLRLEFIAIQTQRMIVLPIRAAMDPQDGRILLAGYERRRLDDKSMDLGAVPALESN